MKCLMLNQVRRDVFSTNMKSMDQIIVFSGPPIARQWHLASQTARLFILFDDLC